MRLPRSSAAPALALALGGVPAPLPAAGAEPSETALREALVLGPIRGGPRRAPVHVDPVEAQLVAGSWRAPREGDPLATTSGDELTWSRATAAENGWLAHRALRGGYALWSVQSDSRRTMILHARGHSLVYVNGAPRAGDPYNLGFVRLPVVLRAGPNDLLFRVGRGRLWARLEAPRRPVALDVADRTLPDLIAGEDWGVRGAVMVVNATAHALDDLTMVSSGDGLPTRESAVPLVPPMTVRKVPFWCGGAVDPTRGARDVRLRLEGPAGEGRRVLDEQTVRLNVRRPDQRHRRTFESAIDGSVQYYAVTPPPGPSRGTERPALVLTLHGASVEAARQAAVYRPKSWVYVVAPTNRRPFGFDWEDWGRLDALEVLARAEERYGTDPDRVYLTGHSMGGHGVWHLGLTFPGRFAAIGPSAGWVSFWSYGGAARYDDDDPIEAILSRASSGSDTRALARNALHYGVYILHGEKDDNVPVEQARIMREVLADFHPDVAYHEQPGAGHWWGDRCCDWPPMFAFFQPRRRPDQRQVDRIEFTTANPGISAQSHWLAIEAQRAPGLPSTVVANLDRARRHFVLRTDNVHRLSLDLSSVPEGPLGVTADGHDLAAIPAPASRRLWLERSGDGWVAAFEPPGPEGKGPHRAGFFKDAFRNRMVFVYGTQGSSEENDAAWQKARFDAETFRYRGNGSVDLVADVDFDPDGQRDRNVILYGNADTNAAWDPLLGEGPLEVRRDRLRLGARVLEGADLACLAVRPRPGSPTASVGVVAGTGPAGLRLTGRLPYFVSGVAYPDFIVIGPEMLETGSGGVRAAGFFGPDWSVENGEFAWR